MEHIQDVSTDTESKPEVRAAAACALSASADTLLTLQEDATTKAASTSFEYFDSPSVRAARAKELGSRLGNEVALLEFASKVAGYADATCSIFTDVVEKLPRKD
jgi:hypothetical protein